MPPLYGASRRPTGGRFRNGVDDRARLRPAFRPGWVRLTPTLTARFAGQSESVLLMRTEPCTSSAAEAAKTGGTEPSASSGASCERRSCCASCPKSSCARASGPRPPRSSPYNDFLDWIGFGGSVLKSGDPVEELKQVTRELVSCGRLSLRGRCRSPLTRRPEVIKKYTYPEPTQNSLRP